MRHKLTMSDGVCPGECSCGYWYLLGRHAQDDVKKQHAAHVALAKSFRGKRDVDAAGITNADRVARAEAALTAYVGTDRPDESHLSDLLCDLMHMAHSQGRDFGYETDRARRNYESEA
jgi:hypothetical protein